MRILLLTFLLTFLIQQSKAQGCVAIKGAPSMCTNPAKAKGWFMDINTRYFKSYKHFVGTQEQKQRETDGSNVINNAFEMNVNATRVFNTRNSISISVPFLSYKRTSLYEHDGKDRHQTHSFGIGDIRVAANRWMLDPNKSLKANFQVGLGIKLPTGNYNSQDYFYKKADSSIVGPVDQSIQLGDGGTGLTFELNGFYSITHKLSTYTNLYYLVNPKEINGTSTSRGSVASATAKKYNTDVMSVPDVFMTRLGISYMEKRYTFSIGIRAEGLPSKDLVGGSRGFRRPGYIISGEPGINYEAKKINYTLAVPFALKRNRTQSNSDKRRTADSGIFTQGDAAFADYLVSFGLRFKL